MKSILIILLFVSIKSGATSYYFASTGSDNNAGTISAPFKTLDKLKAITLVSGDQILLNKGDTFYSRMSIVGVSGITVTAYGSGVDPVITALKPLTNWTSTGSGIYKTSCDSCGQHLRMVTVNGESKGMGRWPNSGYRHVIGFRNTAPLYLTDDSLITNGSPNWTGASIVQRKVNWVIDIDSITRMSGDTLFYFNTEGSNYTSRPYYGYFIQDDIKTLDTLHEWFYNKATKEVSMYFGANNPSAYYVRASTMDTLVTVQGASNITFTHITFEGGNETTILLRKVHYITFDMCSVNLSGRNGIFGRTIIGDPENSSFTTITNSSFQNSNNNAIELQTSFHHNTFVGNSFRNTSIIEGMGMSDDNAGQAIVATGTNGLFKYNNIKNCGYLGINWNGDSSIVTKNVIDSFCLNKSDGAAIYTYTGGHVGFKNRREVSCNIITNGIGNKNSSDLKFFDWETHDLVMGIYDDFATDNVLIKNNTIANCASAGIYLLMNRDIRVENNNLYNNTTQVMYNGQGLDTLLRVTGANNKMILGNVTQRVFGSSFTDIFYPSDRFDSNYVAVPNGQANLYMNFITLDSFKTKSNGFEAHTKQATKTSTNVLLKYNPSEKIMPVWLDGTWYDAAGKAYSNTIFLDPYTSVVLMKINPQIRLKGIKLKITR